MADNNVVEVVDLADRDQRIFDLRLQGKSVRAIARQFRISMREVDSVVESMCTPIDLTAKARAFELELMRLDALQEAAYAQAIGGNISAIMAVAKLMERRACMIGYDSPVRHDPIQVLAQVEPVTTTDRIQLVLNELAQRQVEKPSEPDVETETE